MQNRSFLCRTLSVRASLLVVSLFAPLAINLASADPAPAGTTTTPAQPAPASTASAKPAAKKKTTAAATTTPATSDKAKVAQLPTIVVTAATRTPQSPDTTATSTTVVTNDDIANHQDITVIDSLSQIPGLSVVSTGAPGQPASVFIRGNDSDMTLLTIDGRRQASNILGGQDFSNLTLDNIGQVEVVRTPSSTMQGGNSAGGIINLVSLTGQGLTTPISSASFEGGSYGYYRENVQSRGADGNFDYAVSASELTDDNNRINENVRDTTYRGNFGYQISPDIYVDVHSGYSLANVGAPNTIETPNPLERVESQDWFISPEIVAKLTDFYTSKIYFNYDEQRLVDNNPYTDFLNNFASNSTTTIDTESVDWQNNFQIASHWKLIAGIQFDNSSVNYYSLFPAFGPATTLQNGLFNIGGYVESDWEPITGLNVISSVREDQYSEYASAFSWRQGVSYRVPQTQTLVHATGSSAYTPPSIGDLYFPGSSNPNLKPETTLGWEAGVDQPLLNNKLTPGVTYFHNNITNYIESFAPNFIPENIGQATTEGVEANIDAKPLDNLSLNLNYTYLNAVDDTTQTRLLRRPLNTLNFTAVYNPIESVTLTLGGSWFVDSQDTYFDPVTFTSTQSKLPDYFTLRASVTWKIDSHVSVWVRGENITNEHYEQVFGYPALGAAVYSGVKVTF